MQRTTLEQSWHIQAHTQKHCWLPAIATATNTHKCWRWGCAEWVNLFRGISTVTVCMLILQAELLKLQSKDIPHTAYSKTWRKRVQCFKRRSLWYRHWIHWIINTLLFEQIKDISSNSDRLKVLGCQSFPSSWISNRIPSFSLTKGLCHQLESQRGTEQFRIFSEYFCCHLVTLPGIAD